MQTCKYVERISGEKNGRHYDLVKFTDGVESFTVQNGVGDAVEDFSRGDEVNCEFEVSAGFKNSVRVKLVKVESL